MKVLFLRPLAALSWLGVSVDRSSIHGLLVEVGTKGDNAEGLHTDGTRGEWKPMRIE
jgi:hypothetical protein